MIVVYQLKVPVVEGEHALEQEIRKKLGLRHDEKTPQYRIIKKSTDARKKPDIYYIYSVSVDLKKIPKKADRRYVKEVENIRYSFPIKVDKGCKVRPVIVGFGPAGMFCALYLARAGIRPIVIERGSCVEDRTRAVNNYWETGKLLKDSNVQFGEGGAGTFSDGKLQTGIGGVQGRTDAILRDFVSAGAPEQILYENKPHVGTDILTEVVKNIRNEIISLGGEVRFNCRFDAIETKSLNSDIREVTSCSYLELIYRDGEVIEEKRHSIECSQLILALGHSARDTFKVLNDNGINMVPKSFAVGVRIEHEQSIINEAMYGTSDGIVKMNGKSIQLPSADYKRTAKTKNGRSVYSFCMCPGGYVVNSSSEQEKICVNGMSYSKRDSGKANSALIVSVTPDDFGNDVFSGLEFQRQLEALAYKEGNGKIPYQTYGEFSSHESDARVEESSLRVKGNVTYAELKKVLPEYVSESIIEVMPEFERRIKGFSNPNAILYGVETRTSSPLRILRDSNFESSISGVIPCGEGAGYAGGITSAAVDGIKTAEHCARLIAKRLSDEEIGE